MAKKSQKRRSRNKDQRGCLSGLIDIFDFRQGRSTRKLLEDDRHANKQVQVSRGKSNIQKVISSDAENYDTVENAKTSVKKLMEEEMINEKGSKDQISNSKQGNCSKKNKDRGKNRCHDMTHCMDIISELDAGNEKTNSSNVLHLEKLMEELAQFELSDLSTRVVNENLIASVRRCLEQRMSKSKHFGEESKELMDVMEMLGSNKGLLSKLLQESTSLKSDENGKRQNIFRRRRSKSLGSFPSELANDDDNQSRSKRVTICNSSLVIDLQLLLFVEVVKLETCYLFQSQSFKHYQTIEEAHLVAVLRKTTMSATDSKWKNTALLVIDMQKDFIRPGGPMHVKGGEAIVPNVIEAVDAARSRRIPIIWVVREHDPLGRDVELFRRHLYSPNQPKPTSKGGEGSELVDGLMIKGEDYKLVKTRFSAFFNTHLNSYLRGAGIDSLIITGVQTPNCIRQTVFDAVALDYRKVTVIVDATAAATPDIHIANLFDMKNVGVETPALEEWRRD